MNQAVTQVGQDARKEKHHFNGKVPDDDVPLGSGKKSGSRAFNSIEQLDKLIFIKDDEKSALKEVEKRYHMLVTNYYLSLIKNPLDENDPIRLQCIPHVNELNDTLEASIDPLGEKDMSPVSCLVHRYPDRALLLVTGTCFMYCRHCTRKRLWESGCTGPMPLDEIQEAVNYVRNNTSIREIIVSGGDPLTLPTERLDYILSLVSDIPHIEVIRIGTRAPVVFPQRVDAGLAKALEKYNRLWINVQFNHPNEVTPESAEACRRLQKCGIPLSNQSVLLKGINDDPAIMIELCHKLQNIRVRPYYLFQCDPVIGASHFRTSVFKGIEIMEHMRGHTSGMCIPVFVIDGPEGKGKIPVGPNYVLSMAPDKLILRNYKFQVFDYENPAPVES
ncbi:MAG: KamA family radical SAM protein [Candidatus Auribacter fodinae]|jgi:lysine 2,3-aminomutase|uniref:KamA family radical SAM protein n=1 Tax=Candidatus Auribacter fodinae TaxID=2093366 RepID=A0A3A4R1Z6_9BACT|nr:MAG: KamA family radical SAM protein [Candidatus Auribacter fodinae]